MWSLFLRFNGHFPGKPGLAGFIEAKDVGSGGDSWSYKSSCKAPVKSSSDTTAAAAAAAAAALALALVRYY